MRRQTAGCCSWATALRRRALQWDERQGRLSTHPLRWTSPRTTKETYVPARDYRYLRVALVDLSTSSENGSGAAQALIRSASV